MRAFLIVYKVRFEKKKLIQLITDPIWLILKFFPIYWQQDVKH